MSETPTFTAHRGLRLFAIAFVFLAATLGLAQTASAAPAPAPQAAVQAFAAAPQDASGPSVAASWSCTTYFYSNAIDRYCTVYSGYLRSYISCSNGWTYYSPWVGPGRWRILQICPSGTYRTGSGVQTVG
ncbi:hypothetical protein AB0A74_36285 [Saccharothrix sp. NPDC042600]|uniref:hypothetical protein n=1 Tax=Saccharothrix TaxID=2071 RepID=UPI003405EBC2|nr:hypothetical protein GCM10017745_39560 [Saccharothrix mutabilis subsp. capreolus]